MGYAIIPEPGTEAGPCAQHCPHFDCAATRADAASACVYCGDEIGYGAKYFRVDSGLAHFICHVEACEA